MIRRISALLALMFTLSLAALPVAAQDVNVDDLDSLGIKSGYMRMYLDITDTTVATAESDVLGVMIAGFEFDDAKNLDKNFEDFVCGFAGGFMDVEDATDCDGLVDEGFGVDKDIAINDNDAIEITGEANIDGPTPVNILAIKADTNLFMVITLGDDSPGVGDALGGFLTMAEVSTEPVMFDEDGASTGGFFDMLPQEGDDLLNGMVPWVDMDFLADEDATPTA